MSTTNLNQVSWELVRLVAEEYNLRQAHYWRTVNRFAMAIITLNIAPHFRVGDIPVLARAGIFVVVIALFLCIAASWLLNAEYMRLKYVRATYENLLPPGTFRRDMRSGIWPRLIWLPIGHVTTFCFLAGFTTLTIGNLFLVGGFPK
jgi:hypothetical protein